MNTLRVPRLRFDERTQLLVKIGEVDECPNSRISDSFPKRMMRMSNSGKTVWLKPESQKLLADLHNQTALSKTTLVQLGLMLLNTKLLENTGVVQELVKELRVS